MAVTAEAPFQEAPWVNISQEQYAHSLSTIRRLGRMAVEGEMDFGEAEMITELAFADFNTAIAEMLKTDPEFRQFLDVNNRRTHSVIDGMVRAADGTPMVEVLFNGVGSSEQAARLDPTLKAQVLRDACDVDVAMRVDRLLPGQTLWALSMDPKDELAEHSEAYKKLGYKEGLAYIQTYSKVDENTLVASSYSVDMSDEASWRPLLAQHGMDIPEEASLNSWLHFGVETTATAEEAHQFAQQLRTDYYAQVGDTEQRYSVNEYVEHNQEAVRKLFEAYYVPLASAVHTGRNNETIEQLAATILTKNISDLNAGVKQQLIRVANGSSFKDDAGRVMDSVIRYAVVEQLRKGLTAMRQDHISHGFGRAGDYMPPPNYAFNPMNMHNIMADNIQAGVAAGRSYGGCPGNIELNARAQEDSNSLNPNSQDAYGGKGSNSEAGTVECEYSGTFCYCCPYNRDGTPAAEPVVITARRGVDGIARCLRSGCGATLDSKGHATKGKIYAKAMLMKTQSGI